MSSSPPLAAKAPENDAQGSQTTTSSSVFPQDSIAQSGPSMGMDTHCMTDRPSRSSQSPTGELTKFHNDIDVYISKPPDYPHSPSKLLLLLTPGTGVKSINNQLQADRFAGEGFVVVMPDQFGGDPAPNSTAPAAESGSSGAADTEALSLIEQVKLRAAETAKSFMIDMWLARQTPEKVLPILHKVLESAKDEFADAVANGGGVYAAGYCFGGKYVMMLAGGLADSESKGRDEEEGMVEREPLIKAGAIAHATLATREDMSAIKAPVSIVCVGKFKQYHPFLRYMICVYENKKGLTAAIGHQPENDQLFPDEILEEGSKHLRENKVEHEIQTYPGVPHGQSRFVSFSSSRGQFSNCCYWSSTGFAVVGEYADPKIKEAQTAAFDQMLHWLKTH